MFPYLFKIGIFELRVYSLMYIIGLLTGMYMVKKKSEYLKLSKETLENAVIICFICGIIGARMYYVAFRWDYYQGSLLEMVAVWHGGLAIHGGIIGAVLGLFVYTHYKQASMLALGDSMIPWLLFAQGLGRIGNLANGEAHGVPTITPPSIIFQMRNHFPDFWRAALQQAGLSNMPESESRIHAMLPFHVNYLGKVYELKEYFPWGISFGNYPKTAAYSDFGALPVHPTFIYEMILNFIFFIPLYLMWRKSENIGTGRIIGWYLIFYGFIRAFVTFFRADDLMAGPFRAPHIISMVMVATGAFLASGYLGKLRNRKIVNS